MATETPFRVLCLDGGGAKGFYTLGVLKEFEALVNTPLHQYFHLIYGTSTGAIIAALLALGKTAREAHDLYKAHVPEIVRPFTPRKKSAALANLAGQVFEDARFSQFKTDVGIVATRWDFQIPYIFKTSPKQAFAGRATFQPGHGATISQAIQASCAAYPFFERYRFVSGKGDEIETIDGGFCANNPTLFAIADALMSLKNDPAAVRVLSVGVGVYPEPNLARWRRPSKILTNSFLAKLLQRTLEINSLSMEQLRKFLFPNVPTIRINERFNQPEMATDFMEHNLNRLNILHQRGAESYRTYERELKSVFDIP